MSSILENGIIDSVGKIVPTAVANNPQRNSLRFRPTGDDEQKIVEQLLRSEKCNFALIEHGFSSTASSPNASTVRNRLPAAWELLAELVTAQPKGDVERHLVVLLNSLESMGRYLDDDRESLREYVSHMQLYSMMPVYLGLDRRDPTEALQKSIALARESVALVVLDRVLESELFELLTEPAFVDSPPCVALDQSLKIRIDQIVLRLDERASLGTKSAASPVHLRPTKEYCEGYWSIVKQWKAKAAHIRIPPKLSIGAIAWPKVTEHWARLSQALLDVSEVVEAQTPVAEFVEIRSSNDPQLSETLDSHLQRCRSEHGCMALVVVQLIAPDDPKSNASNSNRLPDWQRVVIEELRKATDGSASRGFICQAGELALIIDGLERNEVTAVLREVLKVACQPSQVVSKMIETPDLPLVCGVACVNSPSKGFKLDQLTNSAWRCLEAAKTQGAGAVKSIEVF